MKQASHSKSPIHFHTELKAGPQATQGVKKAGALVRPRPETKQSHLLNVY